MAIVSATCTIVPGFRGSEYQRRFGRAPDADTVRPRNAREAVVTGQ